MSTSCLVLQFSFLLIAGQCTSAAAAVDSLPSYNPSTRCHDLTFAEDNHTFAICLQRASNKHHPFNLYTSPSFCSSQYPPAGHLINIHSLSSATISRLFQSLIQLLNTKDSHIDYPEPNFLWIGSNFTQNLTNHSFWCPESCQPRNSSGEFLILKLRCQSHNNSKPCLTTKHTHWDRAPFICVTNQTIKQKKQITPAPPRIAPAYPNDTIVFFDSTPCVVARSNTHQYSFCFRRQACPQSQTSAFCTIKSGASGICQREKNGSTLLTIENDEEYQLINDVIASYSNQTLLDSKGTIKTKHPQRAQWMWIDGSRGLGNLYGWKIQEDDLTPIDEKYWCENLTNCLGGKGRDHIVLNIVCQTNEKTSQVCLATRRQSEPGPFICKRPLNPNEAPVANYMFLRNGSAHFTPTVVPGYERNLTSVYYDEHHCLTVQSRIHLYTFCLRRQECEPRKAYCTKWSQAQKNCQQLKNHSQLLTIDSEDERMLITDIVDNYRHETRLTFNGSSYRYFLPADFLWIDGVQQADNRTYLWKDGLEPIGNHLWCSRNECNVIDQPRAMLNLLCHQNNSLICLGTRLEWNLAPYVCKRVRPIDLCPILFEEIRVIKSYEMLVVGVNRTVAMIKCKAPEYNTEIRVQYQCDMQTKQWNLIYENEDFICPGYEPPPKKSSTQISTPLPYFTPTIPSAIQDYDCSQGDLSALIARLPTDPRYIYSQRLPSYSPSYYDFRLICQYNSFVQITYRCDRYTRQWMYVHGNSNTFRRCSPQCTDHERRDLLRKYFSTYEQGKISTTFINSENSLRLSCFHRDENQWKSIYYQCGTMAITTDQWFRLHSCFELTATTTAPPAVVVSMSVNRLTPACPSPVFRGSPCEYQIGEHIVDSNGCVRKICPSLSQLCQTIRCPPDRICRVILCRSCTRTDYLQAVCEYRTDHHYLTSTNPSSDEDVVLIQMHLNT